MRRILITLCLAIEISCGKIIETKLGFVKGTTMLSRDGKKFVAFLALPYAKPPIGELRFEEPILYNDAWNGTYDATKYPPICPQLNGSNQFVGQEDCLYLNIYVPQIKIQTNLPVWVFIYGGRRLSGNASPNKHGPHYIMDKPVIFVTMTYRINIFGFLSTEDNVISGNYGLKDELTVLKWIQNHITSFGGDPDNVTLSGGSTGGIDVGLHLCSSLSKGLFHRAISQSGHPLRAIPKPGQSRRQTWTLARLVGCDAKRSEDLLKCLRGIPAEKLLGQLARKRSTPFVFSPVIESPDSRMRFLADQPLVELKKSHQIPWMLGINSDEGSIGALGIFSKPSYIENFSRNIHQTMPELLSYQKSDKKDTITDLILEKYFKENPINESFAQMSKIFATVHFFIGAIDCALHYNGKKYFYVYDYENTINYARNYYLRGLYSKQNIGVSHGEELRSLQSYPSLFPPIVKGDDRSVSDRMIDLWYNFVSSGDPNGKENIWFPVSTPQLEYLHINLQFTMKKQPFWDDYVFFKDIFRK